MFDRLQIEDPNAKCNKSRLESLAGFQITILRHALTNFPNAKRVVYSTCSIYSEENEYVVQEVIQSVKHFKLMDLREQYETKWFNFGSKDFGDLGIRCVKARPESDLTNGFFVAVFERISNDEANEFFVKRVVTRHDLQDKNKNIKNTQNPVDEKNIQDNEEENIVNDEMIDATIKVAKKKKKSKTNDIIHEEHETSKKCKKFEKERKRKLENIVDVGLSEVKDEISIKKKKSKNEIEKIKKLETNYEEFETTVADAQKSKKKKRGFKEIQENILE